VPSKVLFIPEARLVHIKSRTVKDSERRKYQVSIIIVMQRM